MDGAALRGSRSDSGRRQLEIDMHGIVRKQDPPLLGAIQNACIKERVHIAVHPLYIPTQFKGQPPDFLPGRDRSSP